MHSSRHQNKSRHVLYIKLVPHLTNTKQRAMDKFTWRLAKGRLLHQTGTRMPGKEIRCITTPWATDPETLPPVAAYAPEKSYPFEKQARICDNEPVLQLSHPLRYLA